MNRTVMIQAAASAILAFGSMGCMAIGSVQTAQTLGQGNYEVSIEPGVYGAAAGGRNVNLPSTNVAFRFGVSDRVDIGGRVGTTLGELQTKFLLSSPENESFALSLAPAIGGFMVGTGDASVGFLNIPIPVLIGFKFGEHELTFGPRIQNLIVFGGASVGSSSASSAAYVLLAGGSVGFAAQLGSRFRLLPELALAAPLAGAASAAAGGASTSDSGFVTQAGAVIYMFNLGIQFGSPRSKKKKAPGAVEMTAPAAAPQ